VRKNYWRDRHVAPATRWLRQEPEFMFAWLDSYVTPDSLPQREAEALFRGMPRTFLTSYLEYAGTRPERPVWHVSASDDNGIIEQVLVAR
jgi:hypothetical protein